MVLEQAESGFLDLPEEATKLIGKANAAAGRSDWDTAVDHLREALTVVGKGPRDIIKKNLATSLTNRAAGNVNQAIGRLNNSQTRQAEEVQAFFAGGIKNPWDKPSSIYGSLLNPGCKHCGESNNFGARPSYTVKTPDGGTAELCESCVEKLKSLIETFAAHPRQAKLASKSAENSDFSRLAADFSRLPPRSG